MKEKRNWWKPLLAIPGVAFLDIICVIGVSLLDSMLLPAEASGQGHAAPVLTLIGGIVLAVISGLVIIGALVLSFRAAYLNMKDEQAEKKADK